MALYLGSEKKAKVNLVKNVDISSIASKTENDITVSGAKVTVPSGYYASSVEKSVGTVTQATPDINVSNSGLITASVAQSAGYVTAGTKSETKQLTVQAEKTITPSTSEQTAVTAGVYTTGDVKVAAIPSTTQATPSISVSLSGLITASATQTAGYVSAGTKKGTKQLTTKSATTWTPSTSNQTISSGTYLTGTQTIKGDSNLKAENIAEGVSIFGVTGTYSGGAIYSGETTAGWWTAEDANGVSSEGNMLAIPIDSKYVNVTPTSVAIQRTSSTKSPTYDALVCALWYNNNCFYILSDANDKYAICEEGSGQYSMEFYWNDDNYLCIWVEDDVIANSHPYYYIVSYDS